MAVQLANAITCNNLLVKTLCGMDAEQFEALNNYVSPVVDDSCASETGWEEMTLASTAHLLRTCLSRKDKQQQAQVGQSSMDPVESTEKLKRQIAAVYERVKNGGEIS